MTELVNFQVRHEHKYPLNFIEYQILRKNMEIFLKPDEYAGPDGRYHIRSLYFDDFKNSALFEKQSGIANRSKYRIRIYNYSDKIIKFERKTKLNQHVRKDCVKISRTDADKIIDGDVDFLVNSENDFLKEFYLKCQNMLLRPKVIVDYLREAYVHPIGNVRITFDREIRTGLGPADFFNSKCHTIGVNQDIRDIILEVKFDEVLPEHIRGLFPDSICPRCSLGKFVACRESMHTSPVFLMNKI